MLSNHKFIDSNPHLFIRSEEIISRMKTELNSLEKLRFKTDYLSEYNKLVRLMYLTLLSNGYDISSSDVHKALLIYCVGYLKQPKILMQVIIRDRHRIKYKKIIPSTATSNALRQILKLAQDSFYGVN